MALSGYLLEPDGTTASKVTYIADVAPSLFISPSPDSFQVDYKGDVPKLVAEKVAKKRPLVIKRLAKIAEMEPWI